ncbi:hypothetical protein F4677DRAFT_206196 [Hypoxylon crocopeplum]|nr:hypothetical protein F4677DRAFT_206196 [Hypoxylon crocopeplum]
MPTTQFSPLSEATPDSSPGPSPKRHCLQDPPAYSAIEAAAALGGLAARACEKCRASKRKCDKKLPYCDRCKRLNAKCHYVQDVAHAVNPHTAQFFIYQPRSLSHDALFRSAEPLEGITASQILALVSTSAGPGHPQVDWRSAVNTYFVCIHPWFAVVHPTLFERRLAALAAVVDSLPPQSDMSVSPCNGRPAPALTSGFALHTTPDCPPKEMALLVVAMYLNTRMRLTDAGEQPIFDETYRTVKRLLSSLLLACVGDPRPSIELVQCGALVALYEYGHGEALSAYRTLSQTTVTARVLGIKPGQIADSGDTMMLSVEEEQSGCLWWAMFILEQFIHQDEEVKDMPFLLESPSRNTLLPETPPMTPPSAGPSGGNINGNSNIEFPVSPPTSTSRHLSTGTLVGTEKFGGFQLSAKTSCLFHRALLIDKERDNRPGKMPLVGSYADLDHEIRETTRTLLSESLNWESSLDVFAMLVR